jgi:L-seryl-tRNA(Ser) seleniumtransferase
LCEAALERVIGIGRGYVSLEYDLEAGVRGRRDVHAEPLLCQLTGAEAGIVVNNNAAAVLLMLTALAQGREVIISRGELVEIGGGFRVPDVMRQSGALLREVGTTNRTRVADYAAAISERTALILRVHPSNFVIEGFTERPSLADLTALGQQFNVSVVEDLGSGLLEDANIANVANVHDEPTVQASVRAGVDAISFSGDKLLGGPQAGIIVGRRAQIDAMRRHPLMRALRADKLTYAALEATLLEYTLGRATQTVPVLQMLTADHVTLTARAEALVARLRVHARVRPTIVEGQSAIGGGSAPGARLPTPLVAVEIDGLSADALLTQLRRGDPPIIARIDEDRVVFDLRTVTPEQDDSIAAAIARLAS